MAKSELTKKYLALEGIIGVGKTTQKGLLLERFGKEYPGLKVETSREPGGDEIAEVIRSTVQGQIFSQFQIPMTPICEAVLYTASRAQTVPTIVVPVLKKGKIFLSDRSALTSIAYQGAGRDLGIERIFKLNDLVLDGMWPGLGIVLDVKLELAVSRAKRVLEDKFEAFGEEFFRKAREGYLAMPKMMKGITQVEIVDGNGTVDEVHERVWKVAVAYLGI